MKIHAIIMLHQTIMMLGIIYQHCASLSLLYLLLRLLHVSAFICHLQGASCILLSYLKGRNGYVVVMYI
jgi:hypothetical protein